MEFKISKVFAMKIFSYQRKKITVFNRYVHTHSCIAIKISISQMNLRRNVYRQHTQSVSILIVQENMEILRAQEHNFETNNLDTNNLSKNEETKNEELEASIGKVEVLGKE